MRLFFTSLVVYIGLTIPVLTQAEENQLFDPDKPVSLKSKQITVNQKSGNIIYKGNVKIKQGNLLIRAAKAKTKTVGNKPSQVWASGNPVRVQSKRDGNTVILTAASVHYNIKTGMITLTDNVQLQMGKDKLESKKLSYNVKTNKILVNTKDAPLNASFDSAHIKEMQK